MALLTSRSAKWVMRFSLYLATTNSSTTSTTMDSSVMPSILPIFFRMRGADMGGV